MKKILPIMFSAALILAPINSYARNIMEIDITTGKPLNKLSEIEKRKFRVYNEAVNVKKILDNIKMDACYWDVLKRKDKLEELTSEFIEGYDKNNSIKSLDNLEGSYNYFLDELMQYYGVSKTLREYEGYDFNEYYNKLANDRIISQKKLGSLYIEIERLLDD